jgi:hypothetical protein
MKTLMMLVVAGGLYAVGGTTVKSFGSPEVTVKTQNKYRAFSHIGKPAIKAIKPKAK